VPFGGLTFADSLAALLAKAALLSPIARPLSVVIVVLVTTYVSVILGELVPKAWLFLTQSSRCLYCAAITCGEQSFLSTRTPFYRYDITRAKSSWHCQTQGTGSHRRRSKGTHIRRCRNGVFRTSEKEMVDGVFDLDDRRVTVYMVPRTEVVTIDISETGKIAPEDVIENANVPYLPVVKGDIDDVIGMLDVRTALAAIARDRSVNLMQVMEKPLLMPETISALRALSLLQRANVWHWPYRRRIRRRVRPCVPK